MTQESRRDFLLPFRHRDFAVFWSGSFLSSMGTQFTTLAMAWQLYELTGAGDTISSILRSTINQLSTPDELRGRMSSINSLFTSNGPQLGEFESGVVAAWIGPQGSALTGNLATLLMVAIVAINFPQLRRYEIAKTA
ncbi:MAG: hypothetical protein FJ145_24530 [Deltaproteobacteria bacterium]|nr:hypothetical protein [Deltaproteobacteria bacterium]